MARMTPRGGIVLAVALLAAGCAEQRFRLGFETDTAPPTVTIVNSAGDTIDIQQTGKIEFTVDATDNLGLKSITISLTGASVDTAFTIGYTSAVTSVSEVITLPQGVNSVIGGAVNITATVTDGNNNTSTATGVLYIVNLRALTVVLLSPTVGSVTSPGKQIPIEVLAAQQAGIQRVGWQAIGVVNGVDSAFYALPDTVDLLDTLTVDSATQAGTFIIFGFAVDSAGRRVSSLSVTVTVQLVVNDTIPPVVTFTVPQRAEARDSITVRAKDPSGITVIGWEALDSLGNVLNLQNHTFSGTLTDVSVTDNLNIPSTYVGLVIIKAWGTDASSPPNTDSARVDTLRASPVLYDSILVVNGLTKALPAGGRVADAIYNPNRNELYLSNIALDRLEVFRLADTTFGTAIPVGSKPWGLALWPKDTVAGTNADTVIVANSGGTDFSIVDVALGQQRRRHPLPSYGIQTVKTVVNQGGGQDVQITEYHFDDRPQYVGAVCRLGNCTDSVAVVYSTTPTPGQSDPFPRRGSVRWDLVSGAVVATSGCPVTPKEHFFWEQAGIQGKSSSGASDTLAVVARRCGTTTQLLSNWVGVIVTIDELGFLDTTYVRNSGNFARALIGEGGSGAPPLVYSRALAYDASGGVLATTPRDTTPFDAIANPVATPVNLDQGVSPALDVRNQITNTSTAVHAIGVNFNGLTNLIRADSVFVLDRDLRLKGIMVVGGPNFGMDLNFVHDFNPNLGTSPSGLTNADRIAFVASPSPQIEVFDTYYFAKIASIPIRDPVIGPLRVAKLAGGQQMLVGVTAKGVVTVQLPAVTNSFPASRWGNPVP